MGKIQSIVDAQRVFFQEGKTFDAGFRIKQIKKLRWAVQKYETELLRAMKADLNKPEFEAYETEIGIFLEEAKFIQNHIEKWSKPKRVSTSMANVPSVSKIYREPYGVTLIMAPWNYPVLLSLSPLVGALAAGNCVVLKPSGYSPEVSRVLHKLLQEIYPSQYVSVIQGGRLENQELLEQKFDYIFFTGSVNVGKLVMEAASKNLTPVSLELGGKSPCIVDETADLKLAAKRIVWGKYLNAGQTCVAPDYLLVQRTVKKELLGYMVDYIKKFHGEWTEKSEESNQSEQLNQSGRLNGGKKFTRIVNRKHFDRIRNLIRGEKIVIGGQSNPATLQIAPTILDQITWDAPVMQEEIFGPVMPVLEFNSMEEAVLMISKRPKPLAAYYFTRSRKREAEFLKKVSFGGGCINDTIMHLANLNLPFGGVGSSGMGSYHGKKSFDTFTHEKSVLKKAQWIDVPLRYPPYGKRGFWILKKVLK